jgi:hypothetical protein
MKKLIFAPIIGIIMGILLMYRGYMYYGLGMYIVSILTIIFIIIFGDMSLETKNILQSMILFPILQIISISIPQLFEAAYLRYVLICAIMLIPIYSIAKGQLVSFGSLEQGSKKFYVYLPTVILIGTIVATIMQYVNITSDVYSTSVEIISVGEKFATIFLAISLLISVFLSDTKYWNKYTSDTLDICSDSMLIVFVMTVINKTAIIVISQ